MRQPQRPFVREADPAIDVLRVMFDAVPAFIWVKDCENRILRINRRAADAIGRPPHELEGRPTAELYPVEAARYYQDDLEVIRSGAPKLGLVEPITIAGEQRWVRTDKLPYCDAGGAVIGVIVFAVDITERVHAEAALRQARDDLERRVAERTAELADVVADLRAEMGERRRAEERLQAQQAQVAHLQRVGTVESLAAQLAHEINQPLGAIVNFASGLVRRLQGGPGAELEELLRAGEAIRQQALRAAEVVRRLRDFARRDEVVRVRCELMPVARDAIALLEAERRRCDADLRLDAAPDLPTVEIDRTQIEQVMVNLLANAIEAVAGRPQRAITVRLRATADGGVLVAVGDSGPGLAHHDPQRLFEPFYTTKPDGLGMGLAISRSIVAAHGGTLCAEAAPGGGALFTFRLPGPDGEPPSASPPAP